MKRIKSSLMNAISAQNETLVDLILGILIFGILVILVGLFVAPDRLMFTLGVLLGTASSVARAIHMAVTLEEQMYYNEKDAKAYAMKNYAIRYVFIIIIMVLSVKLGVAGMVGTIIGIFLMKPAAVLAPQIHKYIYTRFFGKGR